MPYMDLPMFLHLWIFFLNSALQKECFNIPVLPCCLSRGLAVSYSNSLKPPISLYCLGLREFSLSGTGHIETICAHGGLLIKEYIHSFQTILAIQSPLSAVPNCSSSLTVCFFPFTYSLAIVKLLITKRSGLNPLK